MILFKNRLFQDFLIVAVSIVLAVIVLKTDIFTKIITSAQEWEFIGSFIAGVFFTSIFTTAPAIVVLGEIAREGSVVTTALLGGLGAVIGDLVIFRFVRDKLSGHISEVLEHHKPSKRLRALFHCKYSRWMTFVVGGMIIASPLPDEVGISMLGFSKMKTSTFTLVSFFFNFFGIIIIGLMARAL